MRNQQKSESRGSRTGREIPTPPSRGKTSPAPRVRSRPDYLCRVILPHHECESNYTDTERFRHRSELRLVREVGLEEVLGLGNAADFRVGRVRGMRDLSLPGGTREPRQGDERVHVWIRWRRNGRQGRVDVSVGGGCRRGPQRVRGCWAGCDFSTDEHAMEG
jgi:hypothetical protein